MIIRNLLTATLFLLSIVNTFAQEFFPMNFPAMTYFKPDRSIQVYEGYLYEKNFKHINDSLYVNDQTNEFIEITSILKNDKSTVQINYYTIASDLTKFLKRAENCGLDKINESQFEKKLNDQFITISVSKNIDIKGQKLNRISFSRMFKPNYDISTESVNLQFPFQNSTWYFQTEIQEMVSKNEIKSIITFDRENKSENRIDFIDDVLCKIAFFDGKEKQSIFANYAQSHLGNNSITYPIIDFKIKNEEEYTQNTKPKKIGSYPAENPNRVNSISEIAKLKNSFIHYNHFFNKDYTLKRIGEKFILEHIETFHYETKPALAIPVNK